MSTSFYSMNELAGMGFKKIGQDVLISRKASIYTPEAISLGDRVRIDDFCILSGGAGIELGSFIHIACYCALFGGAGIVMEDFSGLSGRCTVYSESDDYSGRSLTNPMVPDKYKPLVQRGKVIFRKHVIVGANSTILPGVELGEGCAIGAHSLVRKPCDPWTLYYGTPTQTRPRHRDLLELEKQFLLEWSRGAG